MLTEEIIEFIQHDAIIERFREKLVLIQFIEQFRARGVADLEGAGVLVGIDLFGRDVMRVALHLVPELKAALQAGMLSQEIEQDFHRYVGG